MDLKRPMTLMCFYSSEADHELVEMGCKMPVPTLTTERVFYSIDGCVGVQFEDDGKVYGAICSNGDELVTNIPYDLLKDAVEEHLYGER